MNIVQLLFIFVGYAIIVTMIEHSIYGDDATAFPTLEIEDVEYRELGSCDSLAGCTKYIGDAIANVALGLVSFSRFAIAMTVFVLSILGLLLRNAVTGVDGAPLWLNTIITLIFLTYVSINTYKFIRKGDDD